MATFNPPSIVEVPPVIAEAPVLSNRLFRFFRSRPRGVAVFKMTDGTYQIARQVPGLVGPTVSEPYPATTPDQFPQLEADQKTMVIAQSTFTHTVTTYAASQPQVAFIYYGGHSYTVTAAEAAALTTAGFGAYLS